MRAIVTKEFKGLADGDTAERYFTEGEVIHGALAERAVKEDKAKADAAKGKGKGK